VKVLSTIDETESASCGHRYYIQHKECRRASNGFQRDLEDDLARLHIDSIVAA
jgi:hypothetical protein